MFAYIVCMVILTNKNVSVSTYFFPSKLDSICKCLFSTYPPFLFCLDLNGFVRQTQDWTFLNAFQDLVSDLVDIFAQSTVKFWRKIYEIKMINIMSFIRSQLQLVMVAHCYYWFYLQAAIDIFTNKASTAMYQNNGISIQNWKIKRMKYWVELTPLWSIL